jgi:hypothetical protein
MLLHIAVEQGCQRHRFPLLSPLSRRVRAVRNLAAMAISAASGLSKADSWVFAKGEPHSSATTMRPIAERPHAAFARKDAKDKATTIGVPVFTFGESWYAGGDQLYGRHQRFPLVGPIWVQLGCNELKFCAIE